MPVRSQAAGWVHTPDEMPWSFYILGRNYSSRSMLLKCNSKPTVDKIQEFILIIMIINLALIHMHTKCDHNYSTKREPGIKKAFPTNFRLPESLHFNSSISGHLNKNIKIYIYKKPKYNESHVFSFFNFFFWGSFLQNPVWVLTRKQVCIIMSAWKF